MTPNTDPENGWDTVILQNRSDISNVPEDVISSVLDAVSPYIVMENVYTPGYTWNEMELDIDVPEYSTVPELLVKVQFADADVGNKRLTDCL